jgi:hypothetical protein
VRHWPSQQARQCTISVVFSENAKTSRSRWFRQVKNHQLTDQPTRCHRIPQHNARQSPARTAVNCRSRLYDDSGE